MLKLFVKFVIVFIVVMLVFWLLGFLFFLPADTGYVSGDYKVTQLSDYKNNFDEKIPEKPLRIQEDVDYSLGKKALWWPKGESPILKKLVDTGELPTVAERTGPEPLVLKGIDGTGKYGGVWLRLGDNVMGAYMAGPSLMRWSPGGYPIVPHIAKSIDASKDNKTFVIHLRKGMKWSDGHPFTVDDIMYSIEECSAEPGEKHYDDFFIADGKLVKLTKIDDYTLKMEYAVPKGDFFERAATYFCDRPRHYLRQYHPYLGDKEKIKKVMECYSLGTPRAAYDFMRNLNNPEKPSVSAWICKSYTASDPYVYVRNPYFFAVDPQGNQLPYIDAVQTSSKEYNMVAIAAAIGASSMQMRGLDFGKYTELKTKEVNGGPNEVYLWARSFYPFAMKFNVARAVLPGHPETKWKAKMLGDKRFRHAISMAINRNRINKAIFSGIVNPSQVSPIEPYKKHPYDQVSIKYNPEKANKILDSLGMDKRDMDGYRIFPDGTPAVFFFDTIKTIGTGPSEFIVDDMRKIGIKMISRIRGHGVFTRSIANSTFDMFAMWNAWPNPYAHCALFLQLEVPHKWQMWAWNRIAGRLSAPDAAKPPKSHYLWRLTDAYRKVTSTPAGKKRDKYLNEFKDILADELPKTSTCGAPPQVVTVSKNMCNVPRWAVYCHCMKSPAICGMETYYFDKNLASPGFEEKLSESIIHPVLRPGTEALNGKENYRGNYGITIIKYVFILVLILLLIFLIIKFPFVLKRIAIMVPTLFIISIICFWVVELPPGDYLEMERLRLQTEGNQESLAELQSLKKMFHYDEPGWKRYLRWSGLYWFTSFKSKDTGFLQGNLGRSMVSKKEASALIGDRIAFTVVIGLITLLLSNLVLWPIGIICAVKKGSVFDYGFMFIGFLAMCVPPFLLALVVSVLFGTTGLFSPEFASQPEWDWPKFVDFIKHLWPLLIVMGIGMLAGGGRTLRANILDELHKPYVTTARAKGVRPIKLLLKYPVRLAMNPWASSMGGIFPMLVSGNAMVAIVLALPMVGPLMLQSILDQDVYLACSLLMILSTLSVFGVLISDIILMIVDPRIKYDKA